MAARYTLIDRGFQVIGPDIPEHDRRLLEDEVDAALRKVLAGFVAGRPHLEILYDSMTSITPESVDDTETTHAA